MRLQDDSHLCAPLVGGNGDDDDEILVDSQPYQYVSDSENKDADDLEEEEDSWEGVTNDMGDGDTGVDTAPSTAQSISGIDTITSTIPDTESEFAPDGPPVLTKEEEKHADEVASQILMAQLVDAPWITSELPDTVIEEIIQRVMKQNTASYKYDYLPHIIYVPEEDFDLWVNKGSANTQSTEVVGDPDESPRAKRSCTVYKLTCKAGCKAKLVVHKMMEDHLIGQKRLHVTYYYQHTGHALDPVTMKAIPIAFLITNDHTDTPLQTWFTHIKQTIGTPRFTTIDDSFTEFKALHAAFGKDLIIHLCLWHVMRTWSCRFKALIRGTDDLPGKDARSLAMKELRAILYKPDSLWAKQRIVDFHAKWSKHNK
ncbi:hypothetical protein BGZ74_004284, partial [Mortierella antarctica]